VRWASHRGAMGTAQATGFSRFQKSVCHFRTLRAAARTATARARALDPFAASAAPWELLSWAGRMMNALARQLVAIGCVVLPLMGCQKSLPTAPSDLMTGITVYEHANYLGQSAHITQDIRDLKDFKGPCVEVDSTATGSSQTKDVWNDCISSIRVARGWRATLYRDDDFKDDRLDVMEDIPNLQLAAGDCSKGGFNDCATSIRVFAP
jgi:hypothetical protein